MAHAGGRPVKFSSVEELQSKIDEYFETEDGKETPTVTGLAIALDISRETLNDYGNNKSDEFSDAIRRAKAKVAVVLEQKLYGNNVTGLIFNLKNNFGWKDKTETDIKHSNDPENPMPAADSSLINTFVAALKDAPYNSTAEN